MALNLEKTETASKSNLSNMEQKKLSKLRNGQTIVIKSADKGGAVVILSTGHDHEISSLYGLPKIHKFTVIESAINSQNSEITEIFESNDLKLRPMVGSPKCPTRKLSQLIDILLKPF